MKATLSAIYSSLPRSASALPPLRFQAGSPTAGNPSSRYRSRCYLQISPIPFSNTSFLSPGGDNDKRRNRASGGSTTASASQQFPSQPPVKARCSGHAHTLLPWVQFQQWHKLGKDWQDIKNWHFSYLALKFLLWRLACHNFVLLAIWVKMINVSRNHNFSA